MSIATGGTPTPAASMSQLQVILGVANFAWANVLTEPYGTQWEGYVQTRVLEHLISPEVNLAVHRNRFGGRSEHHWISRRGVVEVSTTVIAALSDSEDMVAFAHTSGQPPAPPQPPLVRFELKCVPEWGPKQTPSRPVLLGDVFKVAGGTRVTVAITDPATPPPQHVAQPTSDAFVLLVSRDALLKLIGKGSGGEEVLLGPALTLTDDNAWHTREIRSCNTGNKGGINRTRWEKEWTDSPKLEKGNKHWHYPDPRIVFWRRQVCPVDQFDTTGTLFASDTVRWIIVVVRPGAIGTLPNLKAKLNPTATDPRPIAECTANDFPWLDSSWMCGAPPPPPPPP